MLSGKILFKLELNLFANYYKENYVMKNEIKMELIAQIIIFLMMIL